MNRGSQPAAGPSAAFFLEVVTLRVRLALAVALGLLVVGAGAGFSQVLNQALCPVGSPFNIRPTFPQFVAGNPGIPLLRRTIDTNLYPNARCNDGSPAVMYIRPANANDAMNPIVQPSNKWVIFCDGGGGCRNVDD